ncbi:hypothetical protein L218DRAFT_949173 [Marasmius fiardii PR-910]|nr:hypothetical protein L218DRAFT_949173 [Marasmius fiardii PR-910]
MPSRCSGLGVEFDMRWRWALQYMRYGGNILPNDPRVYYNYNDIEGGGERRTYKGSEAVEDFDPRGQYHMYQINLIIERFELMEHARLELSAEVAIRLHNTFTTTMYTYFSVHAEVGIFTSQWNRLTLRYHTSKRNCKNRGHDETLMRLSGIGLPRRSDTKGEEVLTQSLSCITTLSPAVVIIAWFLRLSLNWREQFEGSQIRALRNMLEHRNHQS